MGKFFKKGRAGRAAALGITDPSETGVASTRANHKLTPWKEKQDGGQHSLLWLIEHAVDMEMLINVTKTCAYQTQASADTRRKWAAAVERKKFLLEHNPPSYEPVPPAEGLNGPGGVATPSVKTPTLSSLSETIKEAVAGLPPQLPLDSLERRAAVEALVREAEIPREVDPLALVEHAKGALKLHGTKHYSAKVLSTVTEIIELARRKDCPPPTPPPAGYKYAQEDCIYLEYDLKFMAGEFDVTSDVLAETHPDILQASRYLVGAATFSGEPMPFGDPVGAWRDQFCQSIGRRIPYRKASAGGAMAITKLVTDDWKATKPLSELKPADTEAVSYPRGERVSPPPMRSGPDGRYGGKLQEYAVQSTAAEIDREVRAKAAAEGGAIEEFLPLTDAQLAQEMRDNGELQPGE